MLEYWRLADQTFIHLAQFMLVFLEQLYLEAVESPGVRKESKIGDARLGPGST
jgi:hypothetical protein